MTPPHHTLKPQEWGVGRQQVTAACPQQHLRSIPAPASDLLPFLLL